jgi:hypothetical protein
VIPFPTASTAPAATSVGTPPIVGAAAKPAKATLCKSDPARMRVPSEYRFDNGRMSAPWTPAATKPMNASSRPVCTAERPNTSLLKKRNV